MALGAPALSTACVFPLPAQELLYPLSLLPKWAAPRPLAHPPCSHYDVTHDPVAWKGLSLLHSTWHCQGLNRGSIPTPPSRALEEEQGGTQNFCSASPERCSLSPCVPFLQEPVATSTDVWEKRTKGEASLSSWPSCSTLCTHPVLKGLPTSPAHFPCPLHLLSVPVAVPSPWVRTMPDGPSVAVLASGVPRGN